MDGLERVAFVFDLCNDSENYSKARYRATLKSYKVLKNFDFEKLKIGSKQVIQPIYAVFKKCTRR